MGVWKSGAGVPRSSALIITCLFKNAIWYPSFSNTPIWLCLKMWYPLNPLVSNYIPYEIARNVYPPFSSTSSCHIKLAISPFYPHICCLILYLKMSNRLTDPYGGSCNGATPKSSFLFSDFPWNKPSSYWGTPIFWKPPYPLTHDFHGPPWSRAPDFGRPRWKLSPGSWEIPSKVRKNVKNDQWDHL